MRGWFIAPGVEGDRTPEEQLQGVEFLAEHAKGASVLDLGCAEGLIARHFAYAWGAREVHGLTVKQAQVAAAKRFCKGLPVKIWECDLRDWVTWQQHNARALHVRYDIVLALSIVHKMKHPHRFIEEAAGRSKAWLAIRLPKRVWQDRRSNFTAIDPVTQLAGRFDLVAEPATCRGEWLGILKKR